MEINREHFEAYLFAQPCHRPLNMAEGVPYYCPGCLVNNFLRDNVRGRFAVGWIAYGRTDEKGQYEGYMMPDWLATLVRELADYYRPQNYNCTFGDAQRRYIELFGDPNPIDPALNSERVEGKV